MKRNISILISLAILLIALSPASANAKRSSGAVRARQAGAPSVVSFQGQVIVDGQPYTGDGYFKFAIVDGTKTTSFWSNDGSSVSGGEPGGSVLIPVANGLFNVLLGDTTQAGMTQPLTASVFVESESYLRVWFSRDGSSYDQLDPDRRIAAVPYALQAQEAAQASNAEALHGMQSSDFQARVRETCVVGSSIRAIADDGTVICETDDNTIYTSGFGLLLDGDQFKVITNTIQQRVNETCIVGSSIRAIGEDGTVLCETDDNTVYTSGFGLHLDDNQFKVITDTIQQRVHETCTVGSSIRAINSNGTVECDSPHISSPYYPLLQAQSLDLATLDPDLRGFHVGFNNGRYGYFVPFYNGNYFGKVARLDLQNFSVEGITELDLTQVDPQLKSFIGGFTDGRFGYIVPYDNGNSGKVVRLDLQNFSISGVTVLDLTQVDAGLRGFAGGFTDGKYGYFVPYNNGNSGKVARIYLTNFSTMGVDSLDLTTVDPELRGFVGGFSDGLYGYFVPYTNGNGVYSGKVARVDLHNFSADYVTVLNLTALDPDLKGFHGGFSDGRYSYFIPNYQGNGVYFGKVVRVDQQDFSANGVTVLDLTSINPDLKGFQGGFTDGRYGYFVPNGGGYLGKVARVDLNNFSAAGVAWIDLTGYDPDLTGFWGGFSDGRYGYFVPNWNSSGASGKVARIQLYSGAGAP